MKILNAFSLSMITAPANIAVESVTLEQAKRLGLGAESAVGHADTAAIFSDQLGYTVPCNRATVTLARGEQALIGQYVGPRLPEGTTKLPEGAELRWLLVTVQG